MTILTRPYAEADRLALVRSGMHPVLARIYAARKIRSAAELVVWGDRHDATLVDYFLEAGLLAHYADVLDSSASAPSSSGPSSSPSSPS